MNAHKQTPQVPSIQGMTPLGMPIVDASNETQSKSISYGTVLNAAVLDGIIKISKVCSKDQTRFSLCGVYFKSDGRHVTIAATDGHRLIEMIDAENAETLPSIEWILDANELKGLDRVLKDFGGKSQPFFPVEFQDKQMIVCDRHIIRTLDGAFPDYQIYLNQRQSNPKTICFNARLLAEIASAIAVDPKNPIITLTFDGGMKPIKISAKNTNGLTTSAVLMPCQGDK